MTGIFNGIQSIIGNFRSIVSFIKTAWNFFVNVVKSIGDLIGLLANIFSIVSNIILTLPSWLIAFATLTLGICLLYLIVGREHG